MTKKQVWLYGCAFCKKKGRSAVHIKRHEASCTMNPNRICRMCKAGDAQKPIAELMAQLPDPNQYSWKDDFGFTQFSEPFEAALNEGVKRLRELTGNCPACIMAALRQRKIPVPCAKEFKWDEEVKAFWDKENELAVEQYEYP